MAQKSDIILQFLSELRDCTSQWIDPDNVTPTDSDEDEAYPSIDYRFDVQTKRYGQGSKPSPSGVIENDSGETIAQLYRRYKRVRFDCKINTQDLATMLQIGEAVDDYFAQYELWGDQSHDFHDHCNDFVLNGTTGADDESAEPVSRNDIFDIEIEFFKHVRRDGTPIKTVYNNISYDDLDNSGSYDTVVVAE